MKKIIYIMFSVLFLQLIIGGYFLYKNFKSKKNVVTENVVVVPYNDYLSASTLVVKEKAYDQFNLSLKSYKPVEAFNILKNVSQNYATGTPERNVIESDLGLTLALNNETSVEGIDYLKNIAKDKVSYAPLTRALAIESMVKSYYAFHDDKIIQAIFENDPEYEKYLIAAKKDSLKDVNPGALVYLMRGEGLTKYPTITTTLRLAQFDADLLSDKDKITPDSEKEILKDYDDMLFLAEKELKKIEGISIYNKNIAEYYQRLGLVKSKMFLIKQKNYSIDEIESDYKKSFQYGGAVSQVYTLFNYAISLSLIAPQKTETIENLVVRIKNYSEKDREKFDIFIRNSVKNKDAAYKNIENLAEKNENFNQYVQKTIK